MDEEREVEYKQAQWRVVKLGRTDSTTDGDGWCVFACYVNLTR